MLPKNACWVSIWQRSSYSLAFSFFIFILVLFFFLAEEQCYDNSVNGRKMASAFAPPLSISQLLRTLMMNPARASLSLSLAHALTLLLSVSV